jgi:imidazolonepropionase-like amidohydrolase
MKTISTLAWKESNMKTKAIIAVLTLAAISIAIASEQIPAPKQKRPIALVGGTLHTVSGAVISNGTILFDQGKIVALGTNVAIPANAEQIDVRGKHIYPGLIDASSNMGLTEIGSVRGTLDINETGAVNPNARAEVAVHPESELIPVARSAGITITGTSPSGGLIAGTSAAIMLDGWTWETMTLKAPLGLIVDWPTMVYTPSRFSRQTEEEWKRARDRQLKSLRDVFADARAYMIAKQAEQQKGIPYHDTDLRWEAMIPVLNQSIPVFVSANELSQIQAAITWAGQEQVKLVIVGGRDAWRVTAQLKAKDIPVIVTPIHTVSRRWEDYDVAFTLPAKLHAGGIRFCITGGSGASNSRNTPHHAATAAAYGLPKEEALKSITLSAAQILGIGESVGSLEVGKDATLIVTNGDPLELSTNVERVYIQGKTIDLRDKHKRLYSKYQQKYRQLKEQ